MAIDEQAASHEAEQPAGAVIPEQSAGTVTPEQEPSKGSTPDYVSAGEFGRRMKKLDERFDTMLQYIAAQQQAPRAESNRTGPIPANTTKQDLWSRAQQGDQDAFEQYQRIIAGEEYQSRQQTTGRQNLVEAQLNALSQKYPVLNDSSHPLTQKAQTAYQLLLNAGYPQGRATLLEAAKTAIADSPELVSEVYGQGAAAREQARRSGVRTAQSGVTGASYRNDPPRAQGNQKVTSAEADLAGRMLPYNPRRPDEKTPEQRAAGAKKRFLQRQQEGTSNVDPRMVPVIERLSEDF